MTVRQVAADYPECREVFRRFGELEERSAPVSTLEPLRKRGWKTPGVERISARFGHLEPLDQFARRHGVPLEELLQELARAINVSIDYDAPAAEKAHRPFLAAALILTLSLGAGWGAILLFEIGRQADFSAAPAGHILAHGETQLWGFVGLFILGIALRYLPLTTSRPRLSLWGRRVLLACLLFGVAGGFVWSLVPSPFGWLGPASAVALLIAATIFLSFLLVQVGDKVAHTWARFVLTSGIWMLIWAGTTAALRFSSISTGPGIYSLSVRQLLMVLGIFGFGLNAIYGFGQRFLSGLLGSRSPSPKPLRATFWLHNLGVGLLGWACVGGNLWLDAASAGLLMAGAVAYAMGFRGFRRQRRSTGRPEQGPAVANRYVPLAFFWLLAGLAALVAGDVYGSVQRIAVPHAYLGAVRHALTVGFMTTLILGVAQRLVPILGHTLLAWPRLAIPIFGLIAAGSLLRVLTEAATPVYPIAFRLMPLSAVLELVALLLFAANILCTLWPAPDSLLRTGLVTAQTPVALLLAKYPAIEDHLLAWGCGYVGRVRSVPAELTLGSLIASEGMDEDEIPTRINTLIKG
jgi:hypothetical protein